jgi:hypothetical protein
MGSANPKLRNKASGKKSKDMAKGDTATGMRVVSAVATGGKSEVKRAIKRAMKSTGGTANKRMGYKKGGEVMPKAKPC